MKVRSLCTMTLVALLGASLVGGTQAFAVATELPSEGKVVVEEGGDPGRGKTPDPEKPDQKLPDHPEITPNDTAGALMIDQVSNLDFGTIKTSSKDVEAYAAPIDLSKATPAGTGTRGAILGWSDIRGGAYGYTITAELTKQFTAAKDSNRILSNSTIDYMNGMAVADSANKNKVPSNVATGFQLAFEGGAKDVVVANKVAEEGKGTYVMEFGQSKDYIPGEGAPKGNLGPEDKGTDSTSVKLSVPASTASNMTLDTYTATVTWKIVAAE
ncbi:hypothetical protein DOK67_0001205 [Enterococcus sp. DIV0212c]|uniref:WxL domain-containing protein n=1 Tax=Enterococcus sp. DIV0212c TaxID=2230867 RepID=UPI001A9AC772|nr:WxL domain-containing protein [Enterococcus sp. DIV0212c]MBO1353672.1 WxL domain-containing protein [Enterococcus sp. DIV0212c]